MVLNENAFSRERASAIAAAPLGKLLLALVANVIFGALLEIPFQFFLFHF